MMRPKIIAQDLRSLRDQHAPQHTIGAAERRVDGIKAFHWKPSKPPATTRNRAVYTIQHVGEIITAKVKWEEPASQEHQADEEEHRIAAEEQQKSDEDLNVLFDEMERCVSHWEHFLMEVKEIDDDVKVTKGSCEKSLTQQAIAKKAGPMQVLEQTEGIGQEGQAAECANARVSDEMSKPELHDGSSTESRREEAQSAFHTEDTDTAGDLLSVCDSWEPVADVSELDRIGDTEATAQETACRYTRHWPSLVFLEAGILFSRQMWAPNRMLSWTGSIIT